MLAGPHSTLSSSGTILLFLHGIPSLTHSMSSVREPKHVPALGIQPPALLYSKDTQFLEQLNYPGLAWPCAPVLGDRDHSRMELWPFLLLGFSCQG